MHTIHYLVVDVDGKFDESNAYYEACVEDTLNNYAGGDGETWWDWFSVGGRWEGSLHKDLGIKNTGAPGAPNIMTSNTNIAPVINYQQLLPKFLDDIFEGQVREFNENRKYFVNTQVSREEIPEISKWGLEIKDKDHYQTAINDDIRKNFINWQRILTEPLDKLRNYTDNDLFTVIWRMKNLLDSVATYWTPDSHYYDFCMRTANPRVLRDLIKLGAPNLTSWAVVGVDFHY